VTEKDANPHKTVATNRKAWHDYEILERVEAGIVLVGSEVKSLREGHATLMDSFARIEEGEMFAHNVYIPEYSHGGSFNHEPVHRRKLLLHRTEIERLEAKVAEKGFTLIPLSIYFRRGLAKVEIGLCRGKREYEKREDIKKKDAQREMEQALRGRRIS